MAGLLLAIESATDWLSVALLEGEVCVASRASEETRQHATALLPTLDEMLREAGVGLDRIDALAVSAGPGSFTSLRIGLATAKGLAFGRSMEAIGVSTLEAMALSVLEGDGAGEGAGNEVVALLDARRGEWYAGGWRGPEDAGGLPTATLEEGLYAPSKLAARLGPTTRFVSPERAGWRDALAESGAEFAQDRIVAGEAGRPAAEWVGRLGRRRLGRGEGGDARGLVARYLRRAQAEAQRLGGPVEEGIVAALEPGSEGG